MPKKVKKTKVQNNTTHVAFLLDETGSMNDCKSDTIGGFNSFIQKQKSEKNDILFSLTLFNSQKIEKRYVDEKIDNVEELSEINYHPANYTPLWDAIARTMLELKDVKDVLFIIMTDGEENTSKEYSSETVKKMIAESEKKGWQFLFLGADLNDFGNANTLGIRSMAAIDKKDLVRTYGVISDTVSTYHTTKKLNYKGTN